MKSPLPRKHLLVFINTGWVHMGGLSYHSHIECAPEFGPKDTADERRWFRGCLQHEIAHLWWGSMKRAAAWLNEGMALMTPHLYERTKGGHPYDWDVPRAECVIRQLRDLTALQSAGKWGDQFSCNYTLSEALFLDLYIGTGRDDEFAASMRRLHREVLDADGEWPGWDLPEMLKAAFPEQDALIEQHWHKGPGNRFERARQGPQAAVSRTANPAR